MKITALRTSRIIQPEDNLTEAIIETLRHNGQQITEGSILVVAETVVATTQGRIIDLESVGSISERAQELAIKHKMDPRLVHLILQEATTIIGGIDGMLLAEKDGVLIANAGIDKSNSGAGNMYSLWPEDPFKAARELREQICKEFTLKKFGVLISDSRVQPMRRGVVGVTIGAAGFNPVIDCRGNFDLFGHKMEFTVRAMADQLADAAHLVMGECDEQTPFVLIEDVPIEFTNAHIDPHAMLMPMEEDLFFRILQGRTKNYIFNDP